jgi:hypothetical protein
MSEQILVRVNPGDVNYINRIMEGYEYLGVVTTIDRSQGLLRIRSTPDTTAEAKEILRRIPVPIVFE